MALLLIESCPASSQFVSLSLQDHVLKHGQSGIFLPLRETAESASLNIIKSRSLQNSNKLSI